MVNIQGRRVGDDSQNKLPQILDLTDNDVKIDFINKFNQLKEYMFKQQKENNDNDSKNMEFQ